jgi:hypothetical protein
MHVLGGEDPSGSKSIRDQFVGPSVCSELHRCRMVIICPVSAIITYLIKVSFQKFLFPYADVCTSTRQGCLVVLRY